MCARTAAIASVLKWEGILIDPLGALLAVLVFDFIVLDAAGVEHTIVAFVRIIVIGVAFGISSGYVIYKLLDRYLIPDYLRDFAILATVTGIFALSNSFATESGLLAVTVMGIFLANTDLKTTARDLVLQGTAEHPADLDRSSSCWRPTSRRNRWRCSTGAQ